MNGDEEKREMEKPARVLFTIEILTDGTFKVFRPGEEKPLKKMDLAEVQDKISDKTIKHIVVNPFSTFLETNSGCFFCGGNWYCVR